VVSATTRFAPAVDLVLARGTIHYVVKEGAAAVEEKAATPMAVIGSRGFREGYNKMLAQHSFQGLASNKSSLGRGESASCFFAHVFCVIIPTPLIRDPNT
jgi:hypothetical protein